METVMVELSIGRLRKLIAHRKEILASVRDVLMADDAIVITTRGTNIRVNGHTSNDAMTLFMLGKAIGICTEQARILNAEADISDYLNQPNIVAVGHLQKAGLLT